MLCARQINHGQSEIEIWLDPNGGELTPRRTLAYNERLTSQLPRKRPGNGRVYRLLYDGEDECCRYKRCGAISAPQP